MAPRRKAAFKGKAPAPVVVKAGGGRLTPLTAYDAEELDGFAFGTEFELKPLTARSTPQTRLYWLILGRVVKSGAGRWATKEHLHDDLRMSLGYFRDAVDLLTGEVKPILDSTAHDQMRHEEFRAYFDRAMAALAQHLGFDPFELLKDGGPK